MSRLLPADLRAKLPALYANEHSPAEETMVWVKFFTPWGNGTWWITEFDGDDTLFGYVDLGMTYGKPEAGYISLRELEDVVNRFGLPAVERDEYWQPKPWSEALAEYKAQTGQ